jgi:hypothetical protein
VNWSRIAAEEVGDVPGALAPCAAREKMKLTLKEILARGPWRRRRGSGVNELVQGVHGGGDLGQEQPSEIGVAEQ